MDNNVAELASGWTKLPMCFYISPITRAWKHATCLSEATFLLPFICTKYRKPDCNSVYIIYAQGWLHYTNIATMFYGSRTGVQDNSAAHFTWYLKLWNTIFLKAALSESTAMQHFYLRKHQTLLLYPRNWQEYATACKTIKVLCYSTASRVLQPNQFLWILVIRFSQAKWTHWWVLTYPDSITISGIKLGSQAPSALSYWKERRLFKLLKTHLLFQSYQLPKFYLEPEQPSSFKVNSNVPNPVF